MRGENYIFFWEKAVYYKWSMKDVMQAENITYLESYLPDSKVLSFFQMLHFSTKLNHIIKLPLKCIWNKYYLKEKISGEKLCFIIHSFVYFFRMNESNYIEFLKKQYPKCKIVLMFMDTFDSYKVHNRQKELKKLEKNFDKICTYNLEDSKKYGFDYYPGLYSSIKEEKISNGYKSEVFFVGNKKDRLEKIYKIYELLKKNHINCKFFVNGVSKQEQKETEDIIYNKYLPYEEVLKYVSGCKCVLEIVQNGSAGLTFRDFEALNLNKKLLTDNESMKGTVYGKNEGIIYFKELECNDMIERLQDQKKVDYKYQNDYTPLNFIGYLEKVLYGDKSE